jgi:hypothetical protein
MCKLKHVLNQLKIVKEKYNQCGAHQISSNYFRPIVNCKQYFQTKIC